ncbi:MAG: polysaccharide deacetylase family protein [Anaerolineales bacterium]
MTTLIRIALDDELTSQWGPELHWTWRTFLSTSGWAWQQVPLDEPCDIAYTAHPERAPHARLIVQADPRLWARRGALRLSGLRRQSGYAVPEYTGVEARAINLFGENGRRLCTRDVAFDLFWLLTGQEERHHPRNPYGTFNYRNSVWLKESVFLEALVSSFSLWMRQTLVALGCPPPAPMWPHGKRAAAAGSHDVDYPEVIRWLEPLRVQWRLMNGGLGPALDVATGRRHHWHFREWMEMEKALGVRSAFYFTPRQGSLFEYFWGTPDPFYDVGAANFRKLFQELSAEGFEIGMHASYRAYTSVEKFALEKRRLEAASGQHVPGNRHHYWHLNPANPEETLHIHEQIGLEYDTSLNHDRYLGWRRGCAQPFYPYHSGLRRELGTLQLPVAWMDDQLFGMRADNPGDRLERLQEVIDRAAEREGCFIMDVHDYVFDAALFPGWAETYRQAWEYIQQRNDFWCATPAQIAAHWLSRRAALEAASAGLTLGRAASELASVAT